MLIWSPGHVHPTQCIVFPFWKAMSEFWRIGDLHSFTSRENIENIHLFSVCLRCLGVFLHIVADTLGSVGVIISTLLIQNFGWKIADPLCSLFISALIFLSVLPLVRETSLILLQRTPVEAQQMLANVFQKVNYYYYILDPCNRV